MAVTRINNNQVTDAITGNATVGINAGTKLQAYSITATRIANNLTYGSDLTITGNLAVQGTTTNIDTVNTLIQDPLITLADGQVSGTPTLDIGTIGLRGSQQSAVLAWQESAKEFVTALSSTTVSNTTFTLSAYANLHSGNTIHQGTTSLVGNLIGAVNATATITGGNLATPGTVSATSNITGGNLLTGGIMSSTGNAIHGNILTGGQVSATGNATAGNVLTGGQVSATGNGTFGNISTAGTFSAASLSASGNITGGNLLTGGLISAGGNITGGNVSGTNLTGTNVSVTGTATAASTVGGVITGTSTSVTGSQTAASTVGGVITGSSSSVTGTQTAASTVGGVITGTSTSVTGSQTAASTVGGVITGTSTSVTGSQTAASTVGGVITGSSSSVTGNVTGGNILTGGNVSATATVTGGNLATGGTVSATANITGGNLLTGGQVSATATVTGGNLATGGTVSAVGTATVGNLATGGTASATGTITGGNLATGGTASATGNITGGNVLTGGLVSATGNVRGGNVVTDYIYSTAANTTLTITAQTISLNPVGNVGMNGRWINNLADPVADQDAATKYYVDTVAQGLDPKGSVLAATGNTLANLSGGVITYNNGTAGVGATLTTTGTYTTIDGVNIATVGARILVKNEATQANNGIYVFTSSTVLTRAADFNQPAEIPSAFTFVEDGTVYADTGWVCTTNSPVVIGTTAIVFVQFSGAGQYSGGNAISLTGTVINALYDTSANTTIGINGSNQLYIPAGVKLTTPNIGAATGTSVSVTGTVTANTVNSATVSASGNVTGGNVNTGGVVSATANVVAGNVNTGGQVNATATITGGNLATNGTASAGGNITGANILTGGLVSATATVTGGNLATGGTVSATGNATLGNVLTGGQVSATGNGTFGNISTGGSFSATTISVSGNITGGNLLTGGLISAGGNISGTNLIGTSVSVTGTATAASTVGGVITGSSTSVTGTQTAASTVGGVITGSSSSVTGSQTAASTVGGVITGSSSSVTGTQTAASTVGGVITGTSVSISGNVTGGNLATGGTVSAAGTATVGNLATGGTVSATGNITGGNILTGGAGGAISGTGNITGGNILTSGIVSATSGVTGGNIVIAGNTVNMLNPGGTIQVNSGNANTNFSVNGTAANVFYVNATANTASFGSSTQTVNALVAFNSTNSILIPAGTQVQRPGTGVTGMMRFNSTTNSLEIYNNTAWIGVGATVFTVITDEQFNGDGACTVFTLANTSTTASTIVSINGVLQIPVSAYAVSGTAMTFTEAPATGDLIDVRRLTTTSTLLSITNVSGNASLTVSDTTNIVTITGVANVVGDLNVSGNATILGNVATNQIQNGNSAVQIATPNGNVNIDVGSNDSAALFTRTDMIANLNILPLSNVTYNLGSSTQRWKDLWLSNSTIYLGNAQISANATAIVMTNPAGGQTVLAGATTTSSVAGNITGGNILTGGYVSAAGNIVTGTVGNIGVGTLDLNSRLTIVGQSQSVSYPVTGNSTALGTDIHVTGADNTQTRLTQDTFGTGAYVVFTGRAARGTAASPSQTQAGDTITQFTGRGFSSGSLQFGNSSTGRVDVTAAEAFTDTSRATNVQVFTTASGAITPTAIATFSSNTSAALSVAGNIVGANINVTTGLITGNLVINGTISDAGQLDLATTASNGNIVLTPNGTGNVNIASNVMPTANATSNIGSAGYYFNTAFVKATSAQYADLAEKYTADAEYAPGTILVFGGTAEVTVNAVDGDRKVAGVVSTNPSYTMNSGLEAEHVATVALTGRVPTLVVGPVRKGDLMVAAGLGRARAEADPRVGSVIGKALEDFDGAEGTIEVVVGRF